jgi:hypothetical protein
MIARNSFSHSTANKKSHWRFLFSWLNIRFTGYKPEYNITISYIFTAWIIFLMNSRKKIRVSICIVKFYTEYAYIIHIRLPVVRKKILHLAFFAGSWMQKTVLDIIYGFTEIVVRRVAPFKKKQPKFWMYFFMLITKQFIYFQNHDSIVNAALFAPYPKCLNHNATSAIISADENGRISVYCKWKKNFQSLKKIQKIWTCRQSDNS